MRTMTQSELNSRIFDNPNPIFDEELEFNDFIELSVIGNKIVKFNKKAYFLKGAKFQGVDIVFNGAVFHESLKIENVSKIQFVNCSFNDIKVHDCHNIFLSFKNCEINSVYFERTSHREELIFENTSINEFKSVESDFSRLQFISNIKDIITIQKLSIIGKTLNILEFSKVEIGNKSDKSSEYVSSKLNSKISKVIFQNTISYNNVDFNGDINTILFENKPIFYYFNINGKIEFINFNNQVEVKKVFQIKGLVSKLLQISPTAKINECKFNGAEINQFEISGGEIGLISFTKQHFQEKIIISGGMIGEIIIATNLNNVLEIRPEKKIHIGAFNQFAYSEVSFNDLDDKLYIAEVNLVNFTFPKDKNSDFSGFGVDSLSFIEFYNYGNISFSNLNDGLPNSGNLVIENSDLGKMLFMNCDFIEFEMEFLSSKISEIFLAGTSMPDSSKINNSEELGEIRLYNKRLALTQLKKVLDNRGDSFGATKYNEAELDNWLLAIPKTDLENRKLIFSQMKKMYEGRGDTVKAIEYQGKELDVHRTILHKAGGQYWERFQLSLNKYSNNFGQSWQWAIGWIVVVGLLFYILYCLSLGFHPGNSSAEDKQRFWTLASYFFEFINPIRKGEFIKLDGDIYYPISNSSRVIDFVWRIVITYLGYQLIQAFRKYSKKTS